MLKNDTEDQRYERILKKKERNKVMQRESTRESVRKIYRRSNIWKDP